MTAYDYSKLSLAECKVYYRSLVLHSLEVKDPFEIYELILNVEDVLARMREIEEVLSLPYRPN